MTRRIHANRFKAKCLELLDEVQRTKRKIIITKQNKLIAQVVPIIESEPMPKSLFGIMKGTIHIVGDIISPIDTDWDASGLEAAIPKNQPPARSF